MFIVPEKCEGQAGGGGRLVDGAVDAAAAAVGYVEDGVVVGGRVVIDQLDVGDFEVGKL